LILKIWALCSSKIAVAFDWVIDSERELFNGLGKTVEYKAGCSMTENTMKEDSF
jgi:hypothetical protein